jgi:hypothetical protein
VYTSEQTHDGWFLIRNPGSHMAEYRAYIVGHDGRFMRSIDLICPDDETAKEYAKNLVDGHDVELWQADRKIEAFKHTRE